MFSLTVTNVKRVHEDWTRGAGTLPWEIWQFVWRETGGVNKWKTGGFTASWCCSAVGQSHLPGMLQSDPGGAARWPNQRPLGEPLGEPLGAPGCLKHTQASEWHPENGK